MKIRRKKTQTTSLRSNVAWLMATTAMMHFSASPPQPLWAKEPTDEEPSDRAGARLPDRWGRYPDHPSQAHDRWQSRDSSFDRSRLDTRHRLFAQLTEKDKTVAFEIAPQLLATALLRFGEQAGVQFAYTTEDIQGVETGGVTGHHTAEAALALLLARTGIDYRVTGSNTVTLEKKGAPAGAAPTPVMGAAPAGSEASPADRPINGTPQKPVKVPEIIVKDVKETMPVVDSPDGYKADVSSEAVLRFPASIQELPQSVSVVTGDSIHERRAVTQTQALEGVAGISKTNQQGGVAADSFTIRGFRVDADVPGFARDNGLSAFNNYVADPTLYERIEVIKGASSFTSGLVTAGGFVNRLLKAPVKENFVVTDAGAGSHGHYRATLDANGVMPAIPQLAGRFVMAFNEDPGFFRNTGNQRLSLLPSVRFVTDHDFTLTVTGNVQRLRGKGNYGTPTTVQGLIPAGTEDSLLGNDNRLKIDYQSIHVEADKKFAQGFRLKAKGQYSHDNTSYRYAYAFQSNGIGPAGDFGIYGYGRDIKRESFAGEVNLTKEFSLFGNMSSVAIGVDNSVGRQRVKGAGFASFDPGNLSSPQIGVTLPGDVLAPATSLRRDFRFNQVGAFVQGLLKPFNSTTIMLALRQNWISQESEAVFTDGQRRGLNTNTVTPQVGISQRIYEGLNVYASYGESVQVNFGLTANNSLLDPMTGKTAEIGSKWEPFGQRIRFTAALFRTELKNVSTPDPNDPLFVIGGQSQRNQGFELEARGTLIPKLEVNLAYTYLDTKLTESTDPTIVGTRAFNSPRHTISAFGSYDFSDLLTKGLKLGAVVYYRGDVSAIPGFANQIYPSYTRTDLFAIYAPLKWLSFQLNLNNLFEAKYVEGPFWYSAYNQFGAPRHVIGMVRMTF